MSQNWLNEGWIYQIFCGRWEGLDESKSFWNNLTGLDWSRITDLGAKTVYLLGVWDYSGPIVVQEEEGQDLHNHPDRISSMMAITDHTKIYPDLGTQEEFINFIQLLKSKGLKIIVDFVPNHTSTVHPWIQLHPEYYKKNDNQFIYEFSGDVVKLDYDNLSLREEMDKVLTNICNLGIDGVRCDMAHLIPTDYWEKTIKKIRAINENFGFIAECYGDSPFSQNTLQLLLSAGFDATYDHTFYGNLTRVIVEHKNSYEIASHLNHINDFNGGKVIHYAANHDDPPLNNRRGELLLNKLVNQYRSSLTALALLGNGIGLFVNGFICGATARIAHHFIDRLPVSKNELLTDIDEEMKALFKACNLIKSEKLSWFENQGLLVATNSKKSVTVLINLLDIEISLPTNIDTASFEYYLKLHDGKILPGQVLIFHS